jgi:MscS family membrane protein
MAVNKEETVTIAELTQIESLADLWATVGEIWAYGFLGVDISKILIAVLIFSFFLVIRGLFGKYVLNRLHKLTAKSENEIDDKVIDAIIPPIKFIPVILGIFFATQYSGLDQAMGDFYTRFMRSIIAFTIFWLFYRGLEPISHMSRQLEKLLSRTMVRWLYKVVRVLLIFIGGAVILEMWGIQVAPLLAGLGIFGAAVALGAQDMFKNMIGGLTIIAEKKFQPGEWIKVDGIVEGTVDDIGFRSTQVRQFDKAPVQVPNALLSDAVVVNYSRMSHRRIYWKIGVTYNTTTEQLQTIRDGIYNYINNNADFDKSQSTFVHVNDFQASSIDFMVYCFTHTTNWAEWLEVKEKLAHEVKHIVEVEAKASFAFPSQSLYIEAINDDVPTFIKPSASEKNKPKAKAKPKAKKAAKK